MIGAKPRALLVVAALATCLIATACGGSSPSSSESNAALKSAPAPLRAALKAIGPVSGSLVWYDTAPGAPTLARQATLFKDYTKYTGITPKAAGLEESDTTFFATAQAGQMPYSLVEMGSLADFQKAVQAGDLQKLNTSLVPLNQLAAGSYTPYGFEMDRYAAVLTYNTKTFPSSGPEPTKLADIYNTKEFPGKRCLFSYPELGATLESALEAAGVPLAQLYPLDVPKALAELDTIKSDTIWYSDASSAIRDVESGECSMALTWNTRVLSAVQQDHAPLAIVWNGAITTAAVYAIPKGAPNPKAAEALMATWILDRPAQVAYVNKSALTTDITNIPLTAYSSSISEYLPLGANLTNTRVEDAGYFEKNLDSLVKTFNDWLQG